jgi:hypothetical protein
MKKKLREAVHSSAFFGYNESFFSVASYEALSRAVIIVVHDNVYSVVSAAVNDSLYNAIYNYTYTATRK